MSCRAATSRARRAHSNGPSNDQEDTSICFYTSSSPGAKHGTSFAKPLVNAGAGDTNRTTATGGTVHEDLVIQREDNDALCRRWPAKCELKVL